MVSQANPCSRNTSYTRIQIIARLISNDQAREISVKNYSQEVPTKMRFNFQSQEFEDRKSALTWLTTKED